MAEEVQLDLFSDQPIARNSDPQTSHQAAREITASGKRASQQHQCLEAMKFWPGKTSAELASLMGVDRYMVARRLPELRDANKVVNGMARRCRVTGKRAMTWWLRGA